MPEVRTVQFRLLSYPVDAQHHLSAVGHERQPCIQFGGQYAGNVERQRDGLVGLVAFQHTVQLSGLLQHFLGYSELAQFFPVDHVLVVPVGWSLLPGSLLFSSLRSRFHLRHLFRLHLRCLFLFFCHCFFLLFGLDIALLVVLRHDFVPFQELFHRIGFFSRSQVLESLPVLLVVMESHPDQPEMGRFLQLAPEVPDEVFEDARILVELQKRVFVLFLR